MIPPVGNEAAPIKMGGGPMIRAAEHITSSSLIGTCLPPECQACRTAAWHGRYPDNPPESNLPPSCYSRTMPCRSYKPGDILSFLRTDVEQPSSPSASAQGGPIVKGSKKRKHQAGAPSKSTQSSSSIFSEATQAKFVPVQPLPGLNMDLNNIKRRRKTKKGKERPIRPSKKEKAAGYRAGEGEMVGSTAPSVESTYSAPDNETTKPMKTLSTNFALSQNEEAGRGEDVTSLPPLVMEHVPRDAHWKQGTENKKSRRDDTGGINFEAEVDMDKEKAKERRTIFVGNLPTSISKKRVQNIFKEYGEIESVRFRSMALAGAKIDDHGNQRLAKKVSANKRLLSDAKDTFNAYVVFLREDSAEAAIAANNRLVEAKHLRVDRVGSETIRDPKRSVFLGNLPFDAKEDTIRAHVAQELEGGPGDVEGVRLVRDPETQQGKGFGFVLLKDKASVAAALRLNGTSFQGRKIRVTTCGKRVKVRSNDSATRVKSKAVGAKRRLEAAATKRNLNAPQFPPGARPEIIKASFEGRRASDTFGRLSVKKRGSGPAKKSKGASKGNRARKGGQKKTKK